MKLHSNDFKKNTLLFIFRELFLIVFSVIFVSVIVFNKSDLIHFKMLKCFAIAALFFAVLAMLHLLFSECGKALQKFKYLYLILFLLCLFCMQVYVANGIYAPPGWDCGTVLNAALTLLKDPGHLDGSYFMTYPNNIAILLIIRKFFQIIKWFGFSNYAIAVVILNIFIIDISILITFLVCDKLFGAKYAFLAAFIMSALIGISPWFIIPYTDTFTIIFPILIMYIYLHVYNKNIKNTFLLYIVIGALGFIGFKIKPTSFIIIIAVLIVEFIKNAKSKRLFKHIAIVCAVVFGFFLSSLIYNNNLRKYSGINYNFSKTSQTSIPATHFLMMGMQKRYIPNRGYLYGAYSETDCNITSLGKTKKEKIAINLGVIKERLQKFGLKGYLKFLYDKSVWIFDDGTFYFGGEGNFISTPYLKDSKSKFLQSIFLPGGTYYNDFASILQGIWVLVLFLISCPIFLKHDGCDKYNVMILRLTITGILVFLLLFEGRSRYLINHLAIFAVLAAYGFKLLNENLHYNKNGGNYERGH